MEAGRQVNNGGTKLAIALRTARIGLFGAFLVMSKKLTTPAWQVSVGLIIKAAQLLAFVVATEPLTSHFRETIVPVRMISSLTQPTKFLRWLSPSSLVILYFVCLSWIFILLALTLHTIYQFLHNKFTAPLSIRLARIMGQWSAGILFIPLLSMLATTLECSGAFNEWASAGYICDSMGFMVLQGLSVVLCIILFLLTSFFALVMYDSNPLSKQLIAKAHGRVDFFFLIAQVVLVFICDIFNLHLNVWVIVATQVVLAALWLSAILMLMPSYRHAMNTAEAAIASVFLYASLCLLFNEGYLDTDAALMMYMGCPIAALAGIALSNMRATYIVKIPANRINSIYEVELKCRYLLHQALWGHPTDQVIFGYNAEAALKAKDGQHDKQGARAEHVDKQQATSIAEDVDAVDEQDDRAAATRRLIPPESVHQAHAIYSQASSRFRQSPMLHIFFARFYAVFQGNKHMQMSHLLHAERRQPQLDVSYLVFQGRKMAENDSGSSGQMSAMNRVTFEQYAADARKYVLRASTRQVAFWMELCDNVPDISRLHKLSTEMNEAVSQAEHAFAELFALNAQSLVIMRLYAAFNLHVTCNAEKANILLADADRIEDQKSKDHRNEVTGGVLPIMEESGLDVFADNTAVITVSGSNRNLGMITSVNSAGCKLFGYSRAQFERRSVFSLLPTPLDAIHESSLQQYVGTGEGRIVDYTRVVFGVHKNGYLLPMLLCVRASPPSDGPPTFIVLLRELRTDDNHFLMLDDFTIVGASSLGIFMLGIEASTLDTKEVNIRDFVSGWRDHVNTMASGQSVVFCITRLSSRQFMGKGAPGSDAVPTKTDSSQELDVTAHDIADSEMSQTGAGGGQCWVRGRLQHIDLTTGQQIFVLHFQKVSESDYFSIVKAQGQRRKSVELGPHPPNSRSSEENHSVGRSSGAKSSRMSPAQEQHVDMTHYQPIVAPSIQRGKLVRRHTTEEPADPLSDLLQNDSSIEYPSAARMGIAPIRIPDAPRKKFSDPPPRDLRPDSRDRKLPTIKAIPDGLETPARGSAVSSQLNLTTGKSAMKTVKSAAVLNDRDGAGSEGKSQTSETSTATKSMVRLRKLFTENAPPLLVGLKYLRIVGMGITMLAVGLASGISVSTQNSFRDYRGNVQYTSLGADRMLKTFNAMIAIQDLVAGAAAWTTLAGSNYGGNDTMAEAQLRGQILGNITEFTALHRDMYSRILLTSKSESYTIKRITVVRFDLPRAGEEGTVEIVNLFEAGMALASTMAQIAVTPLQNLTQYENTDIKFCDVNGVPGGNVHEQLHATMEAGYTMSMEAKDGVMLTQQTVFGAMVGLLVLISLVVFLPILYIIETTKDAIVIRFVELPKVVRNLLFTQAVKRYKSLKQNCLNDDEDEGDDDDDVMDELGIPPVDEVDKNKDKDVEEGDGLPATDADENVDWNQVMNTTANTSRSKRGHSRKRSAPLYRKTPRSFIMLVLQFIGPLVSLIGFFVVVYVTSTASIEKALTLSSIAASATARSSCSRELIMDIMRMMTVVADRSFMITQNYMVTDTADCISYYLHLLAFGPESGDIRAAFAAKTPIVETGNSPYLTDTTNAVVYHALFSDACPFLQTAVTDATWTLERCRAFGGGIFAQGLQAGINEYTRRTRMLIDRRMRVRVYEGEKEVHGVLYSNIGYDYAADACTHCGDEVAAYSGDNSVTAVPPLVNISWMGDIPQGFNASFYPAGAREYHIREDLMGEDVRWLREADAMYVTPGLFAISKIYSDLSISSIDDFLNFSTLFVVVFLIAFLLLMVGVFLPRIRSTNTDIQTKRTMLLYLPPEIVNLNKAIKSLVHDILAAESDGFSRGGIRTLAAPGARRESTSSGKSAHSA